MKFKKELILIFFWGILICASAFWIKEAYESYDRAGLIFWSMFMGCDISILIYNVLDLLTKLDKGDKNDK